MISVLEFNDLEKTVSDLLSNAKKRHSIYKEIFGNNSTKIADENFFNNCDKYNKNGDVITLEKEVIYLVNNIDKKTLRNLFIIYEIGATSPDYKDPHKEYKNRLKDFKRNCQDEHYINKFIDKEYRHLKHSLCNGLDYARKNFIEK